MNHRMSNLQTAKNFVRRHKVGIAVSVTVIGMTAIQMSAAKQWNDFLKSKDLYEEFYQLNEI